MVRERELVARERVVGRVEEGLASFEHDRCAIVELAVCAYVVLFDTFAVADSEFFPHLPQSVRLVPPTMEK